MSSIEHSAPGLFDKIICAIAQEKEQRDSGRLLFAFLSLLVICVGTLPFSFAHLLHQWQESGAFYFISAPFLNIGMFLRFWQDFILSIIESFPIFAAMVFAANVALLLFTVKLFLHQRGMLLKYLKNSFIYGKHG